MGHYVKFQDWSSADAAKNLYEIGSQVYYEVPVPSGQHQPTGYGYTANDRVLLEEYKTLPPNSPAWNIHPYYAPLWDSGRKYKKGDRVFHIISKKYDNEPLDLNEAYIYKATLRYNGGSKPPNEEVDPDGIRTWELESKLIPEKLLPTMRPWLFPVKKKKGIFQDLDTTNGRNNAFADEIYHPEEGRDYTGWVDPSLYDEDNNLIEPPPIVPKQYEAWHTSVFQADPYNEDVYTVEGLKENPAYDPNPPSGVVSEYFIPFRLEKAIHWGKWTKDYGWLLASLNWANLRMDEKKYWLVADRQFVYTRSQPVDPWYPAQPAWVTYSDAKGFSMEMWGSISSDNIELINAGLESFYPVDNLPRIDAWITPVQVFGETTDYEGNVVSAGTPEEQCKSQVVINFNNPSFINRTVTIFINITSTQYVWEKDYQYSFIYDDDGLLIDKTPILDGNGDWVFYWVYKAQPTKYRTVTQRYNTSDSVYKYDNGWVVRNTTEGINWSDLKVQNQVNYVGVQGFSYQ